MHDMDTLNIPLDFFYSPRAKNLNNEARFFTNEQVKEQVKQAFEAGFECGQLFSEADKAELKPLALETVLCMYLAGNK